MAPVVFEVAGLCGGAGTSTITLGVGGLLAWSGRRVIVTGDEDLLRLCGHAPWDGPGLAELAALDAVDAAAEVVTLARAVAGVPGLSVLGGGRPPSEVSGWDADAVVIDRRTAVSAATGLLAARSDGCLAAGRDHEAAILVLHGGPLDRRGARRLLGRDPTGWMPTDARVARAGLAGRAPAGLPGSWLAALRAALTSGPQPARPSGGLSTQPQMSG